MRYWLLLIACCILASGVLGVEDDNLVAEKASKKGTIESVPELVAVAADERSDDEDLLEDEPKRLVCYLNFELKLDNKQKGTIHVIGDKSGYDNSGDMGNGGEIIKYSNKDFTCNNAARLWSTVIKFRTLFQAKPKRAITIAAWIKIEDNIGQHSIFSTIGVAHTQGQYHFEVNDGVVRWFHRNECKKTVFETMAHRSNETLDKWTHVAGTYDHKTGQAKIYINGILTNQSIGEGMLSDDWATDASIGGHLCHRALRGSIDEFRIYNYALKSDEIKALVGACRPNGDAESRSDTLEPVDNGSEGSKDSQESSVKKSVLTRTIRKDVKASKRQCVSDNCSANCICNSQPEDNPDDDEDDEPKRLVVYYNFEKVNHNKRISDKSGYENSGMMTPGGEILRYSDKNYTCNQAGRLWESYISLRADTFQAKPKTAITVAAWIKLEERSGMHSVFDTCGNECPHNHGVFLFQVNDGVVRWYHKDEKQSTVFETMAHSVPKGRWTHVAGTYDYKTKQAKIFINGEIRNQSIGEGQLSRDWGAKAEIGQSGLRSLRGSIDEFRIYNYALKPDEIVALVGACRAGPGDDSGATDTAKDVDAPAPAVETSGTARSLSSIDKPPEISDNPKNSTEKAEDKNDTKAVL